MVWIHEHITQWHQIRQAYLADTLSVTASQEISQQRPLVQQDMLRVLQTFLDNTITLKEFNTTFQQKTHREWRLFHLRGMSGGLFFNKLVKHIPHEEAFAHLLRRILHAPVDQQDGELHMHAFIHFLEDSIRSKQARRWQLQPARVPFFLSVWWHIQQGENWPLFSFEMRDTLLEEDYVSGAAHNPIERYFVFRARFLALKQALDCTSWELEQLILWYRANRGMWKEGSPPFSSSGERTLPLPLPERRDDDQAGITRIYTHTISRKGNRIYTKGQRDTNHTSLQWLLAKIGLKIGCSIWIAIDDHEKVWNEEKLGTLSLPSLPMLMDSSQQRIQHVDVLWLRKNEVIAAYEIELTTADISKSLLRLSDVALLFPKRDLQLCVVTPQRCFHAVQFELAHPIFQDHDIRRRSKVIIQEHLVQNAEHILRWANSPSVIHDLTLYLSAKEQ